MPFTAAAASSGSRTAWVAIRPPYECPPTKSDVPGAWSRAQATAAPTASMPTARGSRPKPRPPRRSMNGNWNRMTVTFRAAIAAASRAVDG